MCVFLRYSASRGDYEVVDRQGKNRGFVWQQNGRWACRVDGRKSEYRDTLEAAKLLVCEIADKVVAAENVQ